MKTILISILLAGGAAACHHDKPAVAPNSGTGFNGTNASNPGEPVCNNATASGKDGNAGCEPDVKSDSATNTNADGNAGANGTPAH